MALPTNTTTTYATIGIRENLADFIANISPTETVITASIGTAQATNTFFEWQLDALAAPNLANAQLEGDDLTALAITPTIRVGNRTQISTKAVIISGTDDAVNKAGRSTELAYQIRKRALELKRDIEAIVTQNQASLTGAAGVARTTGSMEAWFVTNTSRGVGGANGGFAAGNVTAATDGTQRALTESLLKTVYQQVWNAGGNPTLLLVGGTQKQNVSTFTGNVTRMQETADRKLMTSIDVYESDFGAVKVVPSHFNRNRTAMLIQPDLWKLAYLRPYQLKDIAPTGDSTKKQLIVEYGLMCLNEAASGVIADLV